MLAGQGCDPSPFLDLAYGFVLPTPPKTRKILINWGVLRRATRMVKAGAVALCIGAEELRLVQPAEENVAGAPNNSPPVPTG